MNSKNKVLYTLTLLIFSIVLFPAGGFSEDGVKSEVKEEGNLAAVEKSESEIKEIDENSPTGVIRKYEKEVKDIVKKYELKKDQKSTGEKNAEILDKVRGFFDIPKLAELSLGKHWMQINAKQRKDYSDVFASLIEKSYISKSDQLIGDYNVEYGKEQIENDKALVNSSVKKDDADVDIVYEMHKRNGSWMIYNVIVDTTNLVKNYQTQFNSIIGKEGFEGLMRRMKGKLTGE